MMNAPKNSLTAARRVVNVTDDLGRPRKGLEEVIVSPGGAYYHWIGWYIDAKTRSSGRCRKIDHAEACRLAEEIGVIE